MPGWFWVPGVPWGEEPDWFEELGVWLLDVEGFEAPLFGVEVRSEPEPEPESVGEWVWVLPVGSVVLRAAVRSPGVVFPGVLRGVVPSPGVLCDVVPSPGLVPAVSRGVVPSPGVVLPGVRWLGIRPSGVPGVRPSAVPDTRPSPVPET